MPAEQRIQIKRRASEPSSTSAWQGLLDGELGYIKNTNKLYIGNGKGVAPTLISTLSWDELTGKPTSILSQIYLNSTDPTKIVYKKVGNNTEYTLGNFAPLTNGLIDLKYLPQGALERLVVVANATARLKLTTANVQLGDTVKETDTGLMYVVVDESKLNSEDGYQVYVAGRAAAVDWTGIENKVNATVSSAGLMSAADKKKLDNTNVAYGTCSTAASTTQKDIVITSQGNWSLQIGSIIVVKFTYTNTAQNPVFKVGNAAAKSVWYNTALISTSNLSYAGYANRPSMYMYDGTQFVWLGWTVDSNSDTKVTQSAAITTAGEYPVLLGYGTATTAVTNTVNKATAFTYNPNTKILTAGTFKGKLTGNADTATKLKTARTIALSGGATGTATSFDGSGNITIPVTNINPASIGDGYTTKGFYINTHPENSPVIIPFINNDIAYLLKRGGSAVVKYDGVVQNIDISNVFDGSPSYWSINPTNITEIVIELTLHKVFTWSNTVYVDMGSKGWRAKNIKLEVINTNYTDDVWTTKVNSTNRTLSQFKHGFNHKPVGADNEGGGFNKIRLTFSDWNTATIFRIAQIGIINYGSFGLRETFLPRDGGEMYGNISPYNNSSYDLGSSSKKWNNVYANTFNGNLTGNADTATILKNARTLTIGNTGKAFNGSANVSWTLAEIGAVAKAGDTMTGFLTLHANPTANLHAATKQYVDATVENAAKLFTVTTTITTDTASSVVFDTSTVNLNTCLIYYNGLLMTPGVNYSITNNTTIALSGWTANKGDIFTVSGKQADETSVIAAGKLTCGNVGSSTKPVYFENGIPVECTSIEDKKVTQSETTASNYRPVVLGYTDNTDASKLATSVTNQVYVSTKFYAQPSTGTFVATKFKGALEGNASTATKATQDGNGNVITSTYLPLSGGTITGTSGDTPLYLKSASTATWLGFKNSSGTNLGFFGFSGTNIPSVYLDKTYKLLHDGNYNSYSPTLTGGGATGTWGISISGNAATSTKIAYPGILTTDADIDNFNGVNVFQATTWTHTSSPGVSNGIILNCGWGNNAFGAQIAIDDDPTYFMALRQKGTSGWSAWKKIPMADGTNASGTWNISISGNAATATKLATARTIFGIGFNGTGNVAGKPLVYGTYTSTAANRFCNSGIEVRENGLVGNTQSDIGYAPSIGFHWSGKIAASLLFHSDGNFYLRKQNGTTRATLDANLNGNAATATSATKATKDGNGATIASTYLKLSGGTMTGALVVPVNTDYTTYRARNIASNTSALTSGSSGLSNGYIYLQYK